MAEMTPLEEALCALDQDLPRSGLSVAAQLEYDRLKPVWERGVPTEVLQSYLDAEAPPEPDPQPAGQRVQQPGATHTFRPNRRRNLVSGIGLAGLCVGAIALGSVDLSNATGSWDPLSVILVAALTGFLVWGIWVGICMPFTGVRISGGKLAVRNFLRTYTVNASEIRAITLESKGGGQGGARRVPQVHLTDGRSIWLMGLSDGPADTQPEPELVKALDEIRMLLGMTASSSGSLSADR